MFQFSRNHPESLLTITQDILGTVKIFILLFIVLTGLVLLTFGIATVPDPGASFRNPFAGSSHSSYDYALALFKVIATYAGWSNASYVLNEVKNPVRTLKIAGPLGLSTVGIFYFFANIAFFSAATPQEIGESGVTVAALFLGKVFGEGARRVAGAFVATSALGNIMTVSFSLSRVDQELAKEGMLPFSRFWASNWPTGSPSAALFLVFFYTCFIIVAVPFGKLEPSPFETNSLTLVFRRCLQFHPRRHGISICSHWFHGNNRLIYSPTKGSSPASTLQDLAAAGVLLPRCRSIPHSNSIYTSSRRQGRYKSSILVTTRCWDDVCGWWCTLLGCVARWTAIARSILVGCKRDPPKGWHPCDRMGKVQEL